MKVLKFTPYAWAKLVFLRDKGKHEISCFGITEDGDFGTVVDVQTVKQKSSVAYTEFFEDSLADFFEEMVEKGLHPSNFARIWCHTHPGNGVTPSNTDEECFRREFSNTDWAIMFILGTENATSCRLKFNTGPGGSMEVKTGVDWGAAFPASDIDAWEAEYERNIKPFLTTTQATNYIGFQGTDWQNNWQNKTLGTPPNEPTKPAYGGCGVRILDPVTREWVDKEEYMKTHKEATKNWGGDSIWSSKRSPIGFYQQKEKLPPNATKREKKYFKKHGTMKGFMQPKNPGYKKLDQVVAKPVSRNFCNEQMSDEEIIDEVFDDLRNEFDEAYEQLDNAKTPEEEQALAYKIDKLEEEWACVCAAVGRELDWDEASDTELEEIEDGEIVSTTTSSESDEAWMDDLAESVALQKSNEAAMDSELSSIPYLTKEEEIELLDDWPAKDLYPNYGKTPIYVP